MASRTENTTKNLIFGIANQIINLLLPFLARSIMIQTLGVEYLGLNGLFASILDVLNISELGISSAIVFSMYKPIAEGNDDEVCALLNLYKKCYQVIGLVVLAFGICVLPFLRHLIRGDVPPEINIYILYMMQLLSTVMTYELFAYMTSLLIAEQRNSVVSRVQTLFSVLKFLGQTAILFLLKNYYIYLIWALITNIGINIVCAIMAHKFFPQFTCKGKVEEYVVSEIKKNVAGMIYEKIGNVALFSADSIVISAFLGLRQLAIYQNYYVIFTGLNGFFAVIQTSLIASVGNSIAKESSEKNFNDFKKFNFLYVWIASWCCICVMCLIQPFMRLWLGEELMLSNLFGILFGLYLFIFKWGDMVYIYQTAAGLWWENRFVSIGSAILNLVLNIVMVQFIGLYGIVISTIISILGIYNTVMPYNLFNCYFKDKGRFWIFFRNQLIYLAASVCAWLLTFYLCSKVNCGTLLLLIIRAIICITVPNIIYIALLFRMKEGREAISFVMNIIKRKLNK